jgi:16S rRNA (adenine1518-N6/adenine1519-N6)-dimethyltransferase
MARDEEQWRAGKSAPPVRKSLGQHFLTDRRILGRIADAVGLTGTETVIEIGPGRGALTEMLLSRAGRVIAIEYDRALAALLRTRYADDPRVTIIEADVLAVDIAGLVGGDYLLAGNVPYYITTPILFQALRPPRPRRAVYLVQKEVAERIVAAPGSESYGALSVNVQAVARATQLFRVAPGAFRPPPKVESAVVLIEPLAEPIAHSGEEVPLRTFVQAAFGMRRKQMQRVLRSLYNLDAVRAGSLLRDLEIDPESRPEVLSPWDFVRLLRALGPEAIRT